MLQRSRRTLPNRGGGGYRRSGYGRPFNRNNEGRRGMSPKKVLNMEKTWTEEDIKGVLVLFIFLLVSLQNAMSREQ
jgi:hypothetical protein